MPENRNLTQATGGAEPPIPISTDSSPSKADVFPPLITVPPQALLTGIACKDIFSVATSTWLQSTSLVNLPLNATQNTVLLNVPLFNDYTNDAIRLLWLLHDRFNGVVDYRVTIFGNQVLFGALEMGVTPTKIVSPTVNDLRIIEGKTVPANGTILYTFSLGTIVGEDGIQRNFWNTSDSMANITSAYLVVLCNVPIMTAMDSSNTNIYIRIESKLNPISAFALTSMDSISSAVAKLTASNGTAVRSVLSNGNSASTLTGLNGTTVAQLLGREQLYLSLDGSYDIGITQNYQPSELASFAQSTSLTLGQTMWIARESLHECIKGIVPYTGLTTFSALTHYNSVSYTHVANPTVVSAVPSWTTTTFNWTNNTDIVGSYVIQTYNDVLAFPNYEESGNVYYSRPVTQKAMVCGYLYFTDTTNPLKPQFKSRPARWQDFLYDFDAMAITLLDGDIIQSLVGVSYTDYLPDVFVRNIVTQEYVDNKNEFSPKFAFTSTAAKVIKDNRIVYVFPYTVTFTPNQYLTYDMSTYDETGSGIYMRHSLNLVQLNSLLKETVQSIQKIDATLYFGYKLSAFSPTFQNFTFAYGEFIIAPEYTLYSKVPETTRRIVFTSSVPSSVSAALALDGIPTSETLTPLTFPKLEKNEIISFDLITPNNFQTIMTVMWDPAYQVFYCAPKDQTLPLYAVYNTHGMGDLLLGNCFKTTIGNLPRRSMAVDFLSRVVEPLTNHNVITSIKNGPTLTVLKKSMIKTK